MKTYHRKSMNWKIHSPMAALLTFALSAGAVSGLGQDQQSKPSRPKKVFTNDDLSKYQDNSPSDSAAGVQNANKEKIGEQVKPTATLDSSNEKMTGKSHWADKIKEVEADLHKKTMEEERFTKSLADFQKKLSEAKTEFQKKTARWQVEDTERNLDRATAERKKAEEEKDHVLEEAVKKGFKLEDLKKEEAVATKVSQ
jgi:hypothetical protein